MADECKRCKRLEELIKGTSENFRADAKQEQLTQEEREALNWAAGEVDDILNILKQEGL